jgi:hypothetical protein
VSKTWKESSRTGISPEKKKTPRGCERSARRRYVAGALGDNDHHTVLHAQHDRAARPDWETRPTFWDDSTVRTWTREAAVLRRLWDRHGDRMRHWLAVVLTIALVITYLEWHGRADWTVFALAVGLLLVLEFALSGDWLRRGSRRRDGPDDRGRR